VVSNGKIPSSMAQQPFVNPWPLLQFRNLFTRMLRLTERGTSPTQGRYLHTEQHKHRINAHRHPCLEWDLNSRSYRSSEQRQFIHYTGQPLWSSQSCNIRTKFRKYPSTCLKVISVLNRVTHALSLQLSSSSHIPFHRA
jgi:hypothetical protein